MDDFCKTQGKIGKIKIRDIKILNLKKYKKIPILDFFNKMCYK